jgi:hypothetical protein
MTELADVFHHYGPSYRAQFGDKMLPSHGQAMRAIEHCRTPALGGHIYTCDACDETLYLYHSCRNRHCPKCQNDKAYLWLEKQHDLLLPVPYFLLTFTLPGELRSVARNHQRQATTCSFALRRVPYNPSLRMDALSAGRWVWSACSIPGAATWLITRTCTTWCPAEG